MKNRTKGTSYKTYGAVGYAPMGMDCRVGAKGFSYLENLYIDREFGDGALESIPGFRRIYSFSGRVNGIYCLQDSVFVHSGEGLYRFDKDDRNDLRGLAPLLTLADRESCGIVAGGGLIISDGERLYRVTHDGRFNLISDCYEIAGCRSMAVLGDRLMLAAHPDRPERIISLRQSGDENYSEEGFMPFSVPDVVRTVLVYENMLWCFGDGGVRRYRLEDNRLIHDSQICGANVVGSATCMGDRVYYMTHGGLYSHKSGECLASGVNSLLLGAESEIKMTVFRGYLLLYSSDEIFLYDGKENWFCLRGVGCYRGDRRVYRYSDTAPEGLTIYDKIGEATEGEVISRITESGEMQFFVEEGGIKYSVYPTEEYRGGEYFAAERLATDGKLLYFGTATGDLCIFNNDMRGQPPIRISSQDGFDAEEYRLYYGRELHPDFYSFAGHAPCYMLVTQDDEGGMPGQRKRSAVGSLTLRCKSFIRSSMTLEVSCDGRRGQAERLCADRGGFLDADFSRPALAVEENPSFSLSSDTGYYTRKRISVYSKDFGSPMGIYFIGYKFRAKK